MLAANSAPHIELGSQLLRQQPFTFELGMPHLGRNNLSESALFKAIGHHRWKQIEDIGGVRSALIRDEAGSRLYATFFFVEVNLPRRMPLSAFGENTSISFNTDLAHYTKVYLDGRYELAGHPGFGVRASNVFIYQERGPSKLSLAVPVDVDLSSVPELAAPPDSLDLCRQARANRSFFERSEDDVGLYEGESEFTYQIDADRDLNGAGLVYFANFISFLDLAERRVLDGLANPVPASLMDARSTYRRRIGYFGNAQSTDLLHIFVKTSVNVVCHAEERFVDWGFNHRILRSSDSKEIVVSSCRKVSPLDPGSEAESWASEWTSAN